MNLQESIRRILREEEDKYDDKVGKTFWFEYHCYESPESCDAEIWYRSHQKVKVIGVSEWSYDDKEWRQEDGNPRVYLVEWEDGFQYDVFEDELMESPNEFYRPFPPKRKIQENIRRILREEVIKEDSRLNYILDKIERYGLKSLSPKEKEFLDNKSLDKDTDELEKLFDIKSRELESRIEYDPREDPNDFYDELGIDFSNWSDEDIDKGRYEIIWNDLDEETINHFFKYFNIDENKYLNDEGYLPGHIPEEIYNDFKKYVNEILLF